MCFIMVKCHILGIQKLKEEALRPPLKIYLFAVADPGLQGIGMVGRLFLFDFDIIV